MQAPARRGAPRTEQAASAGGGRSGGRLLGYGSLLLALVAATLLVVGAQVWLLRFGIVAALWAALLAAFLAVRAHREAASGAERAHEMHAIYQLELEREVAARREYEVTAERDLRRQIQTDSHDELDALRAELRTLRESLQALLGGEVLVEQVALQARSTRLRAMPEQLPTHPEIDTTPSIPVQQDRTVPSPAGRRRAAEGPDSAGATNGQRSVGELLAAHGGSATPRHRRRRGS